MNNSGAVVKREHAEPALVPILGWLHRYRGEWLRLDVVAGLTAAAVVKKYGQSL